MPRNIELQENYLMVLVKVRRTIKPVFLFFIDFPDFRNMLEFEYVSPEGRPNPPGIVGILGLDL